MATENTVQPPNFQSLESEHQKFLAPGEKVIKVFDYANAELMWDLLWGFLPVLLAIILFGFDITGIIIGLFIGSYFILSGLYKKLTLKYLVTDKRVVLKKGLIGQSTVSADYSKITDVTAPFSPYIDNKNKILFSEELESLAAEEMSADINIVKEIQEKTSLDNTSLLRALNFLQNKNSLIN